MRYHVTEGGLEPSAVARGRPGQIFLPSSSGDVTFDSAPRTTGNEAESEVKYSQIQMRCTIHNFVYRFILEFNAFLLNSVHILLQIEANPVKCVLSCSGSGEL